MLSVVIPVWSGTKLLVDMEMNLAKSISNQCDELIICEDGPYHRKLHDIADIYLHHPRRLGHAQNLQSGIEIASGDFIGVLDADIVIKKGSLRDLCIPGKFVEGTLLNNPHNRTTDTFLIWCSVSDAKLLRQYPMPKDTDILDGWADPITKDQYITSSLVEYEHNSGIIAREWNSQIVQ